jgi:predicted RNA-binding Zn-ribbon protein involved in translation (DUF1610 family)
MMICSNCRSILSDPGGDPTEYFCPFCGLRAIQRIPAGEDRSHDAALGFVAGATVGGVVGGPVGAAIGAFLGILIGAQHSKPGK